MESLSLPYFFKLTARLWVLLKISCFLCYNKLIHTKISRGNLVFAKLTFLSVCDVTISCDVTTNWCALITTIFYFVYELLTLQNVLRIFFLIDI